MLLPLIPLPKDLVLLPGVILRVPVFDRQDIPALLSQVFGASSSTRGSKPVPLGIVPLRSPLLSPDGNRLLESKDELQHDRIASDVSPDLATKEDLFNYGTVARLNGVEGRTSGKWALIVEGISRFRVESVTQNRPFFQASASHQQVDRMYEKLMLGRESLLIIAESLTSTSEVAELFLLLKKASLELLVTMRLSAMLPRNGSPPLPAMLGARLGRYIERQEVVNAGSLADIMTNLVDSSFEEKLKVLAAWDLKPRIEKALELLSRQLATTTGGFKLISITSTNVPSDESDSGNDGFPTDLFRGRRPGMWTGSSNPRPTFPPGFGPTGAPGGSRDDEPANELDELQKKLDAARLSEEALKVAARELKRLKRMNPAQAEYQVCRNYLENISEIPWSVVTDDQLDRSTLARARKQLNDDHYGLEKVKKRLLEYLAVLRLKQSVNLDLDSQIQGLTAQATESKDSTSKDKGKAAKRDTEGQLHALEKNRRVDKSPILLLVGPPGTGKTSLAKSVAKALGRKFHRISLGGIRDEADIRGHRRTYVAAMPGLIIAGLKKVGVANPIILLDEIDKVGMSNFQGDPQAALLEVLDPEQNWAFSDHYLGIPFDLSKVLFIATANSLDPIAAPLLDRMETIGLAGYTTFEKRHIAIQHLIPKQITSNALGSDKVIFKDDVVDQIITSYTREAGVRNLEREIGSVCRAKAIQYAEAKDASSLEQYNPLISMEDLEDILGVEKFEEEIAGKTSRPGVVTGLVAYSSGGAGSILFIEVAEMPGKGRVQLTGKLGDVLKESVEVALSWVKGHATELGLTRDPLEDIMAGRNLHVHCPAGAIPKDGPSAGLAHTIAIISLFSGLAVPPTLAMTGEISLRGRVTAVGGIKEKLIGAHRAGVKTVLLPARNRKDTKELPTEVKDDLDIIFVK